ncbi:MAG: site-2 protease family protein, partial [Spirochaetaceae bacterium]|nr:site-2 protease family protein [Spirochaetaceae bacterium]
MDFVKILLGLIGLGIVVFIHELGHFLAARSVGIDVEAFSIGWGKPILKKKVGAVEYRLGMFPLGGYCKMRGENDFAKAWENTKAKIPPDRGTFLGSHPAARMLVAFAGPLFNIIFAAVVFSVIWGIGFEYTTMDNRIVLLHDVDPKESYPADQAGLLSGDRIISINGDTVENFYDMQKKIIIK